MPKRQRSPQVEATSPDDPSSLIYWLVQTLTEARKAGDAEGYNISRREIGELLDADVSTINDFETLRGEVGWPRDPEQRVRAYAERTGVPAQELWRKAVTDWIKASGSGPKRKRR